jgi:hypothetical protein
MSSISESQFRTDSVVGTDVRSLEQPFTIVQYTCSVTDTEFGGTMPNFTLVIPPRTSDPDHIMIKDNFAPISFRDLEFSAPCNWILYSALFSFLLCFLLHIRIVNDAIKAPSITLSGTLMYGKVFLH